MTARQYSYRDAGAPPALFPSAVTPFQKLKSYLRAALVDGYGNKPPAGWTVVSEFDTAITLAPASNCAQITFCQHLPSSSGSSYRDFVGIFVHEGMLDISTPLPKGVNTRSRTWSADTNPTSNDAHILYLGYMYWNYATYWQICADAETFVFCMLADRGYENTSEDYSLGLYVGQYERFSGASGVQGFIAVGGAQGYQSSASRSTNRSFGSGFSSLRDQRSGEIIQGGGAALGALMDQMQYQSMYYDRPEGENPPYWRMQQPYVTNGANYVGRLKGVCFDPILGHYRHGHLLDRLGLPLAATSVAEAVQMDGKTYYVDMDRWGLWFLSVDPAWWPA